MSRTEIPVGRGLLEILLVISTIALPTLLLMALHASVPSWVGTLVALLTLPAAALVSWLLMRRRNGGAVGLGLGRPRRWSRTLGFGLLAGAGVWLAAVAVITPVVTSVFGDWIDPAMLDPLRGDVAALLTNILLVSWLHAALCEEIIFRGFLLQRLEQVLGGGKTGLVIATLLQASLFGLVHYPQGTAGIAATAIGGCLWAAVFVWARRNLWVVIIGHAVMDTVLFLLVFLGRHRLVLPG